ncbi:hypothetical protein DIPPA_15100 [Diplonema papillatum]|nr:hypothetical protein DIPPA_15100 [Diplonema papillatum]
MEAYPCTLTTPPVSRPMSRTGSSPCSMRRMTTPPSVPTSTRSLTATEAMAAPSA